MYTNKMYFPKKLVAKGDKLLGKDKWSIEEDYDNYYEGQRIILKTAAADDADDAFYDDKMIAFIDLVGFPGCCGAIILTGLDSKKKGYAGFLVEAATYIAANSGYTLALATTLTKDRATTAIAAALRAKEAAKFTNRKTKNGIKVWTLTLPPKHKSLTRRGY